MVYALKRCTTPREWQCCVEGLGPKARTCGSHGAFATRAHSARPARRAALSWRNAARRSPQPDLTQSQAGRACSMGAQRTTGTHSASGMARRWSSAAATCARNASALSHLMRSSSTPHPPATPGLTSACSSGLHAPCTQLVQARFCALCLGGLGLSVQTQNPKPYPRRFGPPASGLPRRPSSPARAAADCAHRRVWQWPACSSWAGRRCRWSGGESATGAPHLHRPVTRSAALDTKHREFDRHTHAAPLPYPGTQPYKVVLPVPDVASPPSGTVQSLL